MNKFSLFFLLSFFSAFIFAAELGNLSPEQLIAMQKNNDALVIDIRTEKEWNASGIIPDSHKLQFFSANGNFDAEKWLADLNQLKTSPEQVVILVCRSGNRSGKVGNLLAKKMGINNIHHLSSGISHWIKSGNSILK